MADSINLGDDSIWDDSALVKSWDDALNEYKVRQLNESSLK